MSDKEDLDREMRARASAPRSLPMAYRDPRTGHQINGHCPVLTVTEDDIRRYGAGNHVCGECKHFESGHAQATMAATRFMPTLVRDYEWKLEHLFVSPSNEAGLCGNDDITLTFTMHAACEFFRPHNGKIRREAKENELAKIGNDAHEAHKLQARRIRDWRTKNGLDKPPGIVE